jgi:putative IMPACT (imprinted ancient) family translation regulator
LDVTTDHTRAGRLENDVRAAGHVIRDVSYTGSAVCIRVGVPEREQAAFETWLAAASAGSAEVESVGSDRIDIVPGG